MEHKIDNILLAIMTGGWITSELFHEISSFFREIVPWLSVISFIIYLVRWYIEVKNKKL